MAEELPQWAQDEIKNAKFGKSESQTRTGYILEIYDKDMKVDFSYTKKLRTADAS